VEIELAKITCMIHASLFKDLLHALDALGLSNIDIYSGRMAVLEDRRGLFALLKSAGLASEPVELLNFYVAPTEEKRAISLVASTCRLNIPGRGTVFSERLRLVQCREGINFNLDCKFPEDLPDVGQIFETLTNITCIVQRGKADEMVRALLHIGVVPTVMHASGTGLRDRLGLLRITLPRFKDLITMVVGPSEADFITDKIIRIGHLDRPGRGFVYQTPVNRGIINFKTSKQQVGHAASTEQIIAAIDTLKGGFSWRQGATGIDHQVRRSFMSGIEVSVHMNEGFSSRLAREVMRLGITGATVLRPKVLRPSLQGEQRVLPVRESVHITIPEGQLAALLEICRRMGLCEEQGESYILVGRVLKAFTFASKATKAGGDK